MNKLFIGTFAAVSLVICIAGCKKKEEAPAGGIGVADCDAYIEKYAACIEKMPAAAKGTAEQGFKAQQDAWKAAAATPEGKKALAVGCKATLDSLANNALCK